MTKTNELIYQLNKEGLNLEHKRDKLKDFIRNDLEFKEYTEDMKDLMYIQLDAMNIYIRVLKQRLELIENDIFSYTE